MGVTSKQKLAWQLICIICFNIDDKSSKDSPYFNIIFFPLISWVNQNRRGIRFQCTKNVRLMAKKEIAYVE